MPSDDKTADKKDRNKLIEELHKISFGSTMDFLSAEDCMEITIMTSKGSTYLWSSFEDWRVFQISENEVKKLTGIQEKIKSQSLSFDDIADTCFHRLALIDADNVDLCYLFSDFLSVQLDSTDILNCYFNEYDEKYYFFSSEEQLACALGEYYSDVETTWEEMSTEDLEFWLDQYYSEDCLPVIYLGDE